VVGASTKDFPLDDPQAGGTFTEEHDLFCPPLIPVHVQEKVVPLAVTGLGAPMAQSPEVGISIDPPTVPQTASIFLGAEHVESSVPEEVSVP
jgi:hypothetical protein